MSPPGRGVAAAACLIASFPFGRSVQRDAGKNESGMEVKKGYAPVDGLRIYYEIHGAANSAQPPLMLLHGGGDTIQTSFGHILPELARSRQIIAFEPQGFGHTADIPDRPFSFERSADDTVSNYRACPHDQRFSSRADTGIGINRVASRPMRRL